MLQIVSQPQTFLRHCNQMSLETTKRQWLPHMSAFGGKADMTFYTAYVGF